MALQSIYVNVPSQCRQLKWTFPLILKGVFFQSSHTKANWLFERKYKNSQLALLSLSWNCSKSKSLVLSPLADTA